jgi:anti-sigma factor RsiW
VTENHDPNLVDYAVGLLNAAAARATEAHLGYCAQCRQELHQLRTVDTALRELPPELFLDSPPQGGEMTLHRAMRQVRDEKNRHNEHTRRGGPRRALIATAAAAALVLVSIGSWALGQQAGQAQVAGQAFPAAGAHVIAMGASGAQLTAAIVPATGWVRVIVHVTGIPAGEKCNLIIVDHAGSEHTAASWLTSTNPQGTTITGATVVAPDDVAAVAVKNVDGLEFVSATV